MAVTIATVLALITVAAGLSQAEPPPVYTIDPARSEFVVQVFKAGAGARLAHDHVLRATAYAGRIAPDPADPTTASISVEVQASALAVDEPPVRQRYGLETQLDETQRRQIQATMESAAQLDVARYPVMRFDSTHVEARRNGHYAVTGALTIRGVTRYVEFPVRAEWRDGGVHAWGSFRFKQTDFGFQPYSALLGMIRTDDEVVLHFDVTATP